MRIWVFFSVLLSWFLGTNFGELKNGLSSLGPTNFTFADNKIILLRILFTTPLRNMPFFVCFQRFPWRVAK